MRVHKAFVISIALLGGCGHIAHHAFRGIGFAVETVAAVGLTTASVIAEAARPRTVVVQAPPTVVVQAAPVMMQPVVAPVPTAPPTGPAEYATWIPSRGHCTSGREFHVRCVRNPGGQACFYESEDGEAFDCADSSCGRVPDGLNAWCESTGG